MQGDVGECEADTRQRETDRVGQTKPPRQHGHDRRDQQQFHDVFDAQAHKAFRLPQIVRSHRDESIQGLNGCAGLLHLLHLGRL